MDNYVKGVDEFDNGLKGHIFCIIAAKAMKIYRQKYPLPFTLIYLHVFILFFILMVCFLYQIIGNIVYTCINFQYIYILHFHIYKVLLLNVQGICTRCTRHIKVAYYEYSFFLHFLYLF